MTFGRAVARPEMTNGAAPEGSDAVVLSLVRDQRADQKLIM